MPDFMINRPEADPAEVITSRESVRLAFVSALQYLGPRQRAVLILHDVLGWRAGEVADLLDTSVDAANSTLRRARAALANANVDARPAPSAPVEEALLARYVDAFERFDVDALVSLLREDATISMPPYELWLDGREAFRHWLRTVPDCGNARVIATRANRCPAVAVYRPSGVDSSHRPYAIHVLEPTGDQIASVHVFLDPGVFGLFQLPTSIS
jgi:RNA polymerase sigma-70 factor (ECF subfamily)